jgi:hypothetical protein
MQSENGDLMNLGWFKNLNDQLLNEAIGDSGSLIAHHYFDTDSQVDQTALNLLIRNLGLPEGSQEVQMSEVYYQEVFQGFEIDTGIPGVVLALDGEDQSKTHLGPRLVIDRDEVVPESGSLRNIAINNQIKYNIANQLITDLESAAGGDFVGGDYTTLRSMVPKDTKTPSQFLDPRNLADSCTENDAVLKVILEHPDGGRLHIAILNFGDLTSLEGVNPGWVRSINTTVSSIRDWNYDNRLNRNGTFESSNPDNSSQGILISRRYNPETHLYELFAVLAEEISDPNVASLLPNESFVGATLPLIRNALSR